MLDAAGLLDEQGCRGRLGNEKLRSAYTVMTTGIIMPMSPLVRSLKSLVNWPMLMPYWPSAGPTGGAGVALPAGTWNLTYPTIFCAT
jgi:hypothetical protein